MAVFATFGYIAVDAMNCCYPFPGLARLVIATALCSFLVVRGEEPTVSISSGSVVGLALRVGRNAVDAFYGIPYAKPPTGDLRFRKPEAPEPWNKTFRATVKSSACPQTNIRFLTNVTLEYSDASEDCLYLNVWRPSGLCQGATPCKRNLPVVVFIYGGAFQWGDAGLFIYDAANFVARSDVVFVTFNYRLSIFGFLSVDTPELPGNFGLWDQLLALKWVQRNIGAFGGNSNDVTLGGHSAGAVSAGLLSISPLSKGLFHRTILQSASPLSLILGLAYKSAGRLLDIAGQLECYDAGKDGRKEVLPIVACLKKIDSRTIFDKLKEQAIEKQFFHPVFGDEFIPKDPLAASTWNHFHIKDILTGTTANEGTLFFDNIKILTPKLADALFDDYRLGATLMLYALFQIPVTHGKDIVKEYFGDHDVEHDFESIGKVFSELLGDVLIDCPVKLFADLAASQGIATFKYVFDHRPSYSVWPKSLGVAHADEIPFTFGSLPFYGDESRYTAPFNKAAREELASLRHTREEEEFMNQIVASWSSFVKTGKPSLPVANSSWPEYSATGGHYVNLKPNNFTRAASFKKRCHLFKPFLLKE